jgi:hypothetical protein
MRVSDAAGDLEQVERAPVARQLETPGGDASDVLDRRARPAAQHVHLRIQRIARVLGEQRRAQIAVIEIEDRRELARPRTLGRKPGIVVDDCVRRQGALVQLRDRGHTHRAAERGLECQVAAGRDGKRRLGR